jgi:hypothetical protein
MAFISTDSAEWRALKKLKELGLKSTDIAHHEEDESDFKIQHIDAKSTDCNTHNVSNFQTTPGSTIPIPLATFVQCIEPSPDKGWKLCFSSLYNIESCGFSGNNQQETQNICCFQTIDPSLDLITPSGKPKTKRKSRGNYDLDPQNSYTPARRHSNTFINSITITEKDLGARTWDLLKDFLNQKGIEKHSIVYTLSGIPHSTFNRLINDPKSQPNKETLFKIGIILRLTIAEIKELLESAGLSFRPSDKRDNIIKKCFEKEIFNISDVNQCLWNNNVEEMKFGLFDRLNR